MRLVPMEGDRFHLSAEEAVKLCDENTIGVVAILGSTFDGSYEPVAGDLRRARRPAGAHRARRPGARRRRVRRVRRAVRRPRPRLGLPAPARRVDQRLGAQVRPRLPGRRLDRLARRGGAAGGPDLLGQLPRRQHADVRAQLLAARARRSWRSTTTSSGSASRATARCSCTRAPSRRASSAQIAEIGPFELITRGDELPVFAFKLKDEIDELHRLRRLELAARARLAAARVHVPGEPDRPRGAARRRQARLHPRHGRPAREGHRAAAAAPAGAAGAGARRLELGRVPPLSRRRSAMGRVAGGRPPHQHRRARGRSSRARSTSSTASSVVWSSRPHRKRRLAGRTRPAPGLADALVVDRRPVHGRLGLLRARRGSRLRRRSSGSAPTASRSSSARSSSRVPATSSTSRSSTPRPPPAADAARPRASSPGSRGGSTGSRPRSSSSARSSSTSAPSGRCIESLDDASANLLAWRPDALGSICFLVASWLAFAEAGHGWLSWRPGDLGWRSPPSTSPARSSSASRRSAPTSSRRRASSLNAALANGGTFLGAIGFLVGAALLIPEASRDLARTEPRHLTTVSGAANMPSALVRRRHPQ